MKNTLKGIVFVLLIILSMGIALSVAQTSDNATVTLTVGNATPTVATVEYVDSVYATETAFDPDNSAVFGINATIGDSNTLADIDYIEFFLYDDSVHGADPFTPAANGYDLIKLTWTEATDIWVLDDGAFTEWTETTSVDAGTGSGLSSFEFTARFDISRGAYADTDWEATVRVYDDQAATSNSVAAGFVQMNNYFAITWSTSTITYGSITSLSVNNIAENNRTLTIYANSQWEIRFDATDFTGGATVDIETLNAFKWDEDGVVGGSPIWVRNTQATATGTWDNQARMSATETPLSRNAHFWTDAISDFDADIEYTSTLTVYIFANV